MMLRSVLSLGLLGLTASPLAAHPHVFINSGMRFLQDADGRLAAVEVTWAYDAFYSLMMIEERGLDADGDGLPEADALAAFAGTDVDWAAGFPGDLYLEVDGQAVALLGPEDHAARFEDEMIVTTHIRPLAAPVALDAAVTARMYDPTYFVAYDLLLPVQMADEAGCLVQIARADHEAAKRRVDEIVLGPDRALYEDDMAFPEVGVLFADEVVLQCAGRS
jgi:ABC-type uncharacterized transport system substrate-binding protein